MNIQNVVTFSAKTVVSFVLALGILFGLSLAAVSLWFLNYDAPIIPTCPLAAGSSTVTAMDADGTVMTVAIRNSGLPEIQLIEVTPATAPGQALSAQLQVFDSIPEGKHRLELTFANNDSPIPQTANCKLLIDVVKHETRTYYTIKARGRAAIAPNLLNSLTMRVPLGMLPGLIAIGIAIWSGARFIQGMYDLSKLKLGFRYLMFCAIGRPHPKKPGSPVIGGVLQDGDEQIKKMGGPATIFLRADTFSAIVLEKAGQLTRVERAPNMIHLRPFEKVWDTLDMRPQRWGTNVAAITRDGIPITYKVDVQFQIKDNDDAVLKAATSKWIRTADSTEPERLMIWTKRLIIGAVGGTLRGILAHYELDDLLDVTVRQAIFRQLRTKLEKSAEGLGLDLLDVALGDIKFEGQVLTQWFQTWQTERNQKLKQVKETAEAERMKAREIARNKIRQDTLTQTLETLQQLTENDPENEHHLYRDYILLSFVDTIRNMTDHKTLALSGYTLKSLDHLRKSIYDHQHPPDDNGT